MRCKQNLKHKLIASCCIIWYKTPLTLDLNILSLKHSVKKTGWSSNMSRVCQITGKRPTTGNNVSHANNKTKRRFLPNIQKHRIWVEEEARFITLKISTKGLRLIDKLGIQAVLNRLRTQGEKI